MHDVADTAMSEKEFEKLDAKIEHVADACGIAIDGVNERISDMKDYLNDRIDDVKDAQNKTIAAIGIILGVIQIVIAIIFYYFSR